MLLLHKSGAPYRVSPDGSATAADRHGQETRTQKLSLTISGGCRGARPAMLFPPSTSFSRHRQAICVPTDIRQPGQLPGPGPRIPTTADAGYYLRPRSPVGFASPGHPGFALIGVSDGGSASAARQPCGPAMPKIQSSRILEDSILSAPRENPHPPPHNGGGPAPSAAV